MDGGIIVSGANTASITVAWNCCGSGSVNLIVYNCDGCVLSKTLPVTVHTPPSPVITGPAQVVSGQTNAQYSTPPSSQTGHVYVWTVIGGSVSSGQGTNSITVTWGSYPVCGCGSVNVSETYSLCTGNASYNIMMLPDANVKISGYMSYYNLFDTRMNGVTRQ